MKGIGSGSRMRIEAGSESLVSSAGAALLLRTAAVCGLDKGLRDGLARWRPARGGLHDPGKTVLDLAVAIALGGDCLADIGLVRAQPQLFGPVASDATVSRLVEALAADGQAALAAIRRARAAAREAVWGRRDPRAGVRGPVVIDLDATLVTAYSDKELAQPTYKRGYGFHPLLAFLDHGAGGTGEPLAGMLRPGKAHANDAADQIAVLEAALAQLPAGVRDGGVLVRGDAGSGVKKLLHHITEAGLGYSVGLSAHQPIQAAVAALPEQAWRAAIEADGTRRKDAQVAELTRWLPEGFTGWPAGIRVIARREKPHPGAQLRLTDHRGWRITVFATNTAGGRLADLELRHRLRARCEDRIRAMKDTGLTNLPLHAFAKNQIWLELVQLATDLLTWTQTLAWHDQPARTWEPKRLRVRLLSVAARVITTARRSRLRLARGWPWTRLLTSGYIALAAP